MTRTALRADAVEVAIGATPILRGVSLSIEAGEWVSLVGPSGCGKTTLLHVLALLDLPTAGRVFLGDEVASTWSASARARARVDRIGLVFQDANLLGHLSCRDNVALPVWLRGSSRRQARRAAEALLERFGLSARVGVRASALSMGEAQRVAIARAIANQPEVVLFDEPTGSLDEASGAVVLDAMSAYQAAGGTLLVATHSREVAARSARTLAMRDGELCG